MSTKKRRAQRHETRLTFRCSPILGAALQQAADREQISSSAFARRAVLRELQAAGFSLTSNAHVET